MDLHSDIERRAVGEEVMRGLDAAILPHTPRGFAIQRRGKDDINLKRLKVVARQEVHQKQSRQILRRSTTSFAQHHASVAFHP
jgi:hypothetical protein